MTIRILSYNAFFILAIAIASLSMGGCIDDPHPCEFPATGENYKLSDTATAWIQPYSFAVERIIFETTTGEELPFDVELKDKTVDYQVSRACEVDNSISQTYIGTSQLLEVSLFNGQALSESVFVNVFDSPETFQQTAKEAVVISQGGLFSSSFGTGDELFAFTINHDNPNVAFSDSLVLNGKTFYSVYEMNTPGTTRNLEIKYTKTEGIIYIKDPITSKEYFYKRKE